MSPMRNCERGAELLDWEKLNPRLLPREGKAPRALLVEGATGYRLRVSKNRKEAFEW